MDLCLICCAFTVFEVLCVHCILELRVDYFSLLLDFIARKQWAILWDYFIHFYGIRKVINYIKKSFSYKLTTAS